MDSIDSGQALRRRAGFGVRDDLFRCAMNKTDKKRVDKTQLLGFLIASIPAKPLAQAKLKCGGFFIAPMRAGRPA
ncbi:MAG: hypothetical protein ABSH15_08800 [Verrucomicrobiota bacterium]|jgi:hypothetical protein